MSNRINNEDDSPFHPGERTVHARAGVAEKVGEMGRKMLRDHLIQQHMDFYPLLPWLLIGVVDSTGHPWASVLTGRPGFVRALDPRRLWIGGLPAAGDPIAPALSNGARVGVLGLELHTRRRNRLNGRVVEVASDGFVVAVEQSFGNCPKYIQARELSPRTEDRLPPSAVVAPSLDEAASAVIVRADTLFIASTFDEDRSDKRQGGDVSHRGGPAGFVSIEAENRIVFPDYVGNNAFQTLGNITMNPRVGILFIDFDDGTILQLTGRAEIVWDGPAVAAVLGAQRLVRVTIERVVRRPCAFPLTATFLNWSPTLPVRQPLLESSVK
jgi:predicted pyridoxine 5'-phosphate oxidase superfamily flavin-nucleotide-binding protein